MSQRLEVELERARQELRTAEAEVARLQGLLGLDAPRGDAHREVLRPKLFSESEPLPSVDGRSSAATKLALYRMLFVGRDDVYAQRWDNTKTRKSGWSPAVKGGWGAARRRNPEYLPLGNEVIDAHLTGRVSAGIYPLLLHDTCRLLAADFDGRSWLLDALAYLDNCRTVGVPAVLERSRSGNGGHVWSFFSEPVAAAAARRLGARLLREAMAVRAEIDLASYDRLFPSQDFLPKGSFGNLIALPLQGECRERRNTVFLDPSTLEPWRDQWEFLSSVARLDAEAVEAAAEALRPVDVGPTAQRLRQPTTHIDRPAPPTIRAVLGAALSVEHIGLPPALLASLKHVASLHNPTFYERERLRLSTWKVPGSCAAVKRTWSTYTYLAGFMPRFRRSWRRPEVNSS